MRLTPIEAPNPTFADDDFLNRKPTGDQLTGLIKRIDSPLVIAVDGEWGSGKSHFLKCWKNDPAEDITKIYVDAFKQDYLDDPLIALVSALDEALETPTDTPTTSQKAVGKMKKIAPILGRLALRTGISYATLGAVRNIDEYFAEDTESDAEATAKGATKDASRELTKMTNDFWSAENTRKSAMEAFREALVELTQPDDDKKPTHKIAIIVDELDRCRPDYALNMIEVIKHFFEIDGINFVLGVNMSSLENSVKARYGAGIDGSRYLQKFVTVSLRLPSKASGGRPVQLLFLEKTLEAIGANDKYSLCTYIETAQKRYPLPLRAIQKFLQLATLNAAINGPRNSYTSQEYQWAKADIVMGLIAIKVFHPEFLSKAKAGLLTWEEAETALCLDNPTGSEHHYPWIGREAWMVCTDSNEVHPDSALVTLGFSKSRLIEIANESLDTISLTD